MARVCRQACVEPDCLGHLEAMFDLLCVMMLHLCFVSVYDLHQKYAYHRPAARCRLYFYSTGAVSVPR